MKFERIGNIAEFINGAAFKPNDWQESGLKIIRIQNLTNPDNAFNRTERKVDKKYIVKEGDVLVSWSATIGVFIWYDEPALLNQHIFKVVFDDAKVAKQYFILALKDTIRDLSKFAHGSTMKHVVKGDFDNHKIPLPELSDQLHIVNILTKAEYLISQRKESIRKLDEYLKSTFLEMFGEPVRNEKGWKTVELSKLGSLDRGVSKNRPRNSPELLGGKYPLIQTGEVSNSGLYITSYTHTYSELGLKQSKLWEKGTMLITIAANIAQTSILTFDACFPDSVVGFVPKEKEANSIYIHFLFSFFQKILERNAPQAAQKNINLALLRSLLVPKPPLELQTKFAQIVEKTETLKTQYQQSLKELENLYGSLSQKAFSGELSIKQDGLMVAAEPEVTYSQIYSKIPEKSRGFAKQVLSGKIISMFGEKDHFTHIKLQKLQYLAEHYIEEDLNWNYYRLTAGPYDNKYMHTLSSRLKQNKWFEEKQFRFYPLGKVEEIDRYYESYFGNKKEKLSKLFSLLINSTEKFCEAVATIYAVWNNHIILKQDFNGERIKQDFFEWSNRKTNLFTEVEFYKALAWMQKHEIVPIGFGQLIKQRLK